MTTCCRCRRPSTFHHRGSDSISSSSSTNSSSASEESSSNTSSTMEQLGLYPLSIILTYVGEADGTRLLITKKEYCKQILPMFRTSGTTGTNGKKRHRYRFQVSPVQDPVVLLQRLNTRRLQQRQRQSEHGGAGTTNTCKKKGLSTLQLANWEWGEAHNKFVLQQDPNSFGFCNPPPLELLRFLDQTPKIGEPALIKTLKKKSGVTLLLSYPRSGNTLLRTLLERTTGLVTGSDTRPDRTLSKALAEAHNLVGEGVTQKQKACFVKTHWPERTGCRVFTGHRAVLLVRNPYDAIDSYWNLNVTNTHTETVTDEIYERYQDKFDALARNEMKIWCQYHQYWLDRMELDNFPVLLMRFEDLIQQPAVPLERILQFVATGSTTNKNAAGLDPYWRCRIQHATTTNSTSSLGSYRPRTATKGVASIGKSLHKERYSPDLLYDLHQIALEHGNLLQRFGYDLPEQQFPHNFVKGNEPAVVQIKPQRGVKPLTVKVNSGSLVRPVNCEFGRLMRQWRLQHTNNDTEPFPRVPREKG